MDVYHEVKKLSKRNIVNIFRFAYPNMSFKSSSIEQLHSDIGKAYYHKPKWVRLDELMDLVNELNKMVKDKNCPNNYRNHFYKFKHQLIRELLSNGLIEKIAFDNPVISFETKFGYIFHQPVHYFPDIDIEQLEIGKNYNGGNMMDYNNIPFYKLELISRNKNLISKSIRIYLKNRLVK